MWVCPSCTYINTDEDTSLCDVCLTKLPSTYRKPCRYEKAGNCLLGTRCQYAHNNQVKDPISTSTVPSMTSRKDTLCMYYDLGLCKYGDHCVYSHGSITAPNTDLHTDAQSSINDEEDEKKTKKGKKAKVEEIDPEELERR